MNQVLRDLTTGNDKSATETEREREVERVPEESKGERESERMRCESVPKSERAFVFIIKRDSSQPYSLAFFPQNKVFFIYHFFI